MYYSTAQVILHIPKTSSISLHLKHTRNASAIDLHSEATLGDRSFSLDSSSLWNTTSKNDVTSNPPLTTLTSCLRVICFVLFIETEILLVDDFQLYSLLIVYPTDVFNSSALLRNDGASYSMYICKHLMPIYVVFGLIFLKHINVM